MPGRAIASEQADDAADVWRTFVRTRCPAAREQLILTYLPLVKFVAARMGAGMPNSVEFDELVSYGTIGLIEAVDRFDPKRLVKFETYAVPRIRGAILDEIRALDWVPRSIRARQRELERTTADLRAELRREPEPAEVARGVGCDAKDVRRGVVAVVALEELVALGGGEDGEHVTVLDTISDVVDEPGAELENQELRRVLAEAMAGLADRDYTMVSLYYFGGCTLSDIGGRFGVSESRVSQIHTRALRALSVSDRVRAIGNAFGFQTPSSSDEQVA
jgi:RNA polymerase sigma factor for flagellar operon FliA